MTSPGAVGSSSEKSDVRASMFATSPGGLAVEPVPSEEQEVAAKNPPEDSDVLPNEREFDPTPDGLKEPKESWETQRHKHKALEFSDSLAKTEDDEFQVDPDAEPLMKRRRVGGGAQDGPSWDDDEGIGASGKKTNLPMIIMLVAALLLGATALLASIIAGGDGEQGSLFTGLFQKKRETNLANSLDPGDFYGEVSAVLKNFLEAESVDELIGYIRDPARVAPIVNRYYRERATFEKVNYVALPDSAKLQSHERYMISIVEIEGERPRIVAMEQTPDGFKVDWESWIGYSKISWKLFTDHRMVDPNEFRAMIGRDDYYNFKFSDFLQWRCYQIRDPKEEHRLWGYVERNGTIDKKLQRAMLKSPYAFVVVKLRYPDFNPEDKRNSQVEIEELVEEGWVLRSDNDFDPDADKLDGSFDYR
jgi:hypothetical protein